MSPWIYGLLHAIDHEAKRRGMTRSAFLSSADLSVGRNWHSSGKCRGRGDVGFSDPMIDVATDRARVPPHPRVAPRFLQGGAR